MNDEQIPEEQYEPIEPKKISPFIRFVAAISAVALFLLSIESYFYFIHPEPKVKIALADIQTFLPLDLSEPFTSHSPSELKTVVDESSSVIKQIANKIAADSCRKADAVCQSKAIFYFVRDQINYVSDPKFHDKLENPLVTLKTGGADCEDMAVLVASMEKAIGNDARIVFIPGHAYAQVKILDYKDEWLNMEATCKTCGFNQMPTDTLLENKEYVDI
jgi:transglutaminase-like putative cysteine protease